VCVCVCVCVCVHITVISSAGGKSRIVSDAPALTCLPPSSLCRGARITRGAIICHASSFSLRTFTRCRIALPFSCPGARARLAQMLSKNDRNHCIHRCKRPLTSMSSLPYCIGCRRHPALGSLSCSTLFAYGSQTPHSARARRVCSCCERFPCSSLGVISRLYPARQDLARGYCQEPTFRWDHLGRSLLHSARRNNHASLCTTETSGPIERLFCCCDVHGWPRRVPFPRFLDHCVVAHIIHQTNPSPSACSS